MKNVRTQETIPLARQVNEPALDASALKRRSAAPLLPSPKRRMPSWPIPVSSPVIILSDDDSDDQVQAKNREQTKKRAPDINLLDDDRDDREQAKNWEQTKKRAPDIILLDDDRDDREQAKNREQTEKQKKELRDSVISRLCGNSRLPKGNWLNDKCINLILQLIIPPYITFLTSLLFNLKVKVKVNKKSVI
jgi:hypothetical protein